MMINNPFIHRPDAEFVAAVFRFDELSLTEDNYQAWRLRRSQSSSIRLSQFELIAAIELSPGRFLEWDRSRVPIHPEALVYCHLTGWRQPILLASGWYAFPPGSNRLHAITRDAYNKAIAGYSAHQLRKIQVTAELAWHKTCCVDCGVILTADDGILSERCLTCEQKRDAWMFWMRPLLPLAGLGALLVALPLLGLALVIAAILLIGLGYLIAAAALSATFISLGTMVFNCVRRLLL